MKTRLSEWVRKNPMVAFFALAIMICFGTLFPAMYLIPGGNTTGQILTYYLSRITVYSPVIAGIWIVKFQNPGPHNVPFSRRLKVSLPVWLIAAIINVLSLKLTSPDGVSLAGLFLLSLPVALLPAWVIASAAYGSESLRSMLASLVRLRGKALYYLIALLTFPLVHIIGSVITSLMEGLGWFPQTAAGSDLMYIIPVTFFSVLLFSGGLNEEAGWRGFGQTRLQQKYSPLAAAGILWLGMVIWHIPNDLIQYQHGGYLLVRIGLYPFITILFCWIYNRTRGSIWAVAMFHASMNSMNPLMGLFPITTAGNILLIGFAVGVVLFDRMWRRLPEDHPAVYRPAQAVAGQSR